MSYNSGWGSQFPSHTVDEYEYGWEATPMALDIAAIQVIYGANMTHALGNDTYHLPTSNTAGTYWLCIWDAGGTDTISNAGASSACIINLNAAPLVGANAGGYVSWNSGIVGGVTIANGVILENAIGGSGNDTLTGNSAANSLDGGAGSDTLIGGLGNDIYVVSIATDNITETAGQGTADRAHASVSFTLATGDNIEFLETINAAATTAINLTGNEIAQTITGNAGANRLYGLAGNDTLNGGAGIDTLTGGAGRDQMTGGSQRDIFDFNAISETGNTASTRDFIVDFVRSVDDIDVSTIDASTLLAGNNAFVWKGTGAFTASSAGELRFKLFDNAGTVNDYTIVYGDIDKDTASEFQIQVKGLVLLTSSDFIL